MKQLCVVCVVDARYQRFIPLFAMSVFTSYPDYAVRVYVKARLHRSTRQAIRVVGCRGDLSVLENCFPDYPDPPQLVKTLRWVLHDEVLRAFKYLYIGDVDMLICRERPTLLEFHAERCASLGLPYSNAIRPGSQRLSGLHFIVSGEYFDRTLAAINKYGSLLRHGALDLPGEGRNENFLYKLMKETIGLPPTSDKTQFRRHSPEHGIHLGRWRRMPVWRRDILWRRSDMRRPPSESLTQDEHRTFFEQFLALEADSETQKILSLCPVPEVRRMKRAYRKYFHKGTAHE